MVPGPSENLMLLLSTAGFIGYALILKFFCRHEEIAITAVCEGIIGLSFLSFMQFWTKILIFTSTIIFLKM